MIKIPKLGLLVLLCTFSFVRCPQRHGTYAILNKTDSYAKIRLKFKKSEDAQVVFDHYSKNYSHKFYSTAPRVLLLSEYECDEPRYNQDGQSVQIEKRYVKIGLVAETLEIEILPKSAVLFVSGALAASKDKQSSITFDSLESLSISATDAFIELKGENIVKSFVSSKEYRYEIRFPY